MGVSEHIRARSARKFYAHIYMGVHTRTYYALTIATLRGRGSTRQLYTAQSDKIACSRKKRGLAFGLKLSSSVNTQAYKMSQF